MVQGRLGVKKAGAMVERTMAALARGLVERGVAREGEPLRGQQRWRT